jgi:hypothetical protein
MFGIPDDDQIQNTASSELIGGRTQEVADQIIAELNKSAIIWSGDATCFGKGIAGPIRVSSTVWLRTSQPEAKVLMLR